MEIQTQMDTASAATLEIEEEVQPRTAEECLWKGVPSLPASLVARLAEAADGTRNDKPLYFVAQLQPSVAIGHDVIGWFNTPAEAFDDEIAKPRLLTKKYLIFGPFNTPKDKSEDKPVDKVVVYLKNGGEVTVKGDKFDCLIWSLSAVDKFLVPYYTSMGDGDIAERIRQDFMNEATLFGIHIPGSDIVKEGRAELIPSNPLRLRDIRSRVGLYAVQEEYKLFSSDDEITPA